MEAMKTEFVAAWQKLLDVLRSGDSTLILETLKQDPAVAVSVAVTILVGVLTVFILAFLTKKATGQKKQTVVILGPSYSGKTTLFSKLSGSDWIGTVPSLSPNFGYVEKIGNVEATNVHLVDLPGSPGLAHHIPKHIKQATVLIFMIDSSDFNQHIHETAMTMCQVLDDPHFKKRAIPMLIALNKSDRGARCNTEKFVCSRLQKEIDQIRSQNTTKGTSASPFEFNDLKSTVTISKISVILEDGLDPVHKIMKKYIK